VHRRLDGQGGDNGVAGRGGKQGGQDRGGIGQYQRQRQHPGGVAPQPGDGGGDKADDNEGHTEGDQGTQQIFYRQDYLHDHGAHVGSKEKQIGARQSQRDTDDDTDNQAGGQAA